MKRNIFEILDNKEICYAVCVSLISARNNDYGLHSREYYLIVSAKDRKQVGRLGFYTPREKGTKGVLERDLTTREIEYFQMNQKKFVKVTHNEYGRVYEIKGNSFREYFKKEEPEEEITFTTGRKRIIKTNGYGMETTDNRETKQ